MWTQDPALDWMNHTVLVHAAIGGWGWVGRGGIVPVGCFIEGGRVLGGVLANFSLRSTGGEE